VGFVLLGLYGLPVSAQVAEPPETPGPVVGLDWNASGAVDAPDPGSPAVRPLARLLVSWTDVESKAGEYDWSSAESDVSRLQDAGYRIVLCLTGPAPRRLAPAEPPTPKRPGILDAWLAFLRSAVRTFAGKVEVYQVWDAVPERELSAAARAYEPESYAFVLKSSALALRAEARRLRTTIQVAQASVSFAELDWQQAIWERDIAAYVDVLPVRLDAPLDDASVSREIVTFLEQTLQRPPASAVWALVRGGKGADRAAAAVRALAAGANAAVVEVGPDSNTLPRWAISTHAKLSDGFAPAPEGTLRIDADDGAERSQARVLGRFFHAEDFSTLIFYQDPGPSESLPRDRLIVDTSFVRDTRLIIPLDARELRTPSSPVTEPTPGRAIDIARGPYPMAVQFRKPTGTAGFELPTEAVESRVERSLTAEEIIARHQQADKVQDDRLERLKSRGRIDFHFSGPTGSSFDVAIASNYFWERGSDLEWEQTDYYINGTKIPWKSFPRLPFIQPEKVLTLPLDLTLDRTYAYRTAGAGRVGDREAYVLAFHPADPDAPSNLYRGRIWIDVETFVLLKASLVQTGLEPPVLSNEEVDLYHPFTGPDGETYWLMDRVDGQQTWNIAGRNFVVQREIVFEQFEINPPRETFEAERQRAYASKNTMMRDTNEGFRYLEREPDGSRVVQTKLATSQLFVAAGAFADSSTGGVQPIAGVNYFNFDLWGKGFQTNVFFAGAIAFLNATKPDLTKGGIDVAADAFLSALKFEDKVFLGELELVPERVRRRGQRLSVQFGVPFAKFWKTNFVGSVSYREFSDDEEARGARAAYNAVQPQNLEFIVPEDHAELGGELQLVFNRKGYSMLASFRSSFRSNWEAWGMVDTNAGTFVSFDPESGLYVPTPPPQVQEDYRRWGVTLFKEWYLPHFQKVRAAVNYLDGNDLDRFSQYQMDMFGDTNVGGFSGTGVRFDQGVIGRAGYSFSVMRAVQFEADLSTARIRRRDISTDPEAFTGVELNMNFPGPWKLLFNLQYGYAIKSDIPDLEGEQNFLLIILKLF
jgi:hypothetical protein